MRTDKIIQRVMSLYQKGVESDDTRLTERHIYNKLLTSRARLLTQKAKKKQKINQWNYQVLPCVEMVEAAKHECPCLPPVGCKILRTKEKIPKVLTNLDVHLIQAVTSIEGSVVFSEITWKEMKYKEGARYTKFKPEYFIRGEYLYITSRKASEVIAIEALFMTPEDATSFPSYCGSPVIPDCTSPLERDFPLDEDLIETVVEMANNELVQFFSQNLEDKTNNSSDTEEQRTK